MKSDESVREDSGPSLNSTNGDTVFNLTRLEQQAIIFLTCSLLSGGIVQLIKSDIEAPFVQDYEASSVLADSSGSATDGTSTIAVVDSGKSPGSRIVGLNSATVKDLQSLPGIGPKLAQRIVTYRASNGPFRNLSDLDMVKGIGPMVLARLTPLLSLF